MLDPLAVFLSNTFNRKGLTPIPLISTDHEVAIAAGLAVVTTHRLFKNIEAQNIEAVLTFPLPVHATLFELTAEIDGRALRAVAQERSTARQTYEDAIERGKSAVLHEELLRGVHMISVANVKAGGEIKVITKWALPLSVLATGASLRIPQTVGDLYGRSSLPEADALLTGGPEQQIMLSVRSTGKVEVVGVKLVNGHAKLKNSRPIDIVAELWEPMPIIGNSASGQAVALTLSPQVAGESALNLALLVDHSGSMDSPYESDHSITTSDAARHAVASTAARLSGRDFVDLWEFDTTPTHVGSVGGNAADSRDPGGDFLKLVAALSPPQGGTEIGRAIDRVFKQSQARDVLLLTDGLSEELDVQKLAQAGRRVSAILIGANSIEAKVGHLVALTGGDIFIATADNLDQVMFAAIDSLRRQNSPLPAISEMPDRLECVRNNVRLNVQWSPIPAEVVSQEFDRAAVAIATSLIVGCVTSDLASAAAAKEGIVSHLTSLVLVDEAGSVQETLPALRKVALADPDFMCASAAFSYDASDSFAASEAFSYDPVDMSGPQIVQRMQSATNPASARRYFRRGSSDSPATTLHFPPPAEDRVQSQSRPRSTFKNLMAKLKRSPRIPSAPVRDDAMIKLALQIDWGRFPQELIRGELDHLTSSARAAVTMLAERTEVQEFAEHTGLTAEIIILGLLARSIASEDRHANRVWKAIAGLLKTNSPDAFGDLELVLGSNL